VWGKHGGSCLLTLLCCCLQLNCLQIYATATTTTATATTATTLYTNSYDKEQENKGRKKKVANNSFF
jgi:hypothetical protein